MITASTYPPAAGGVETYAFEMARHLTSFGEDVNVLARSRVRGWSGDRDISNGKVQRAHFKPLLWTKFRHCMHLAPDVLFLTHRSNFLTWALAERSNRGIPVALTVHGNEVYGHRDLERIIHQMNRTDAVFAVSRYAEGRWRDLGIRPGILHTIPHGVALDKFSSLGPNDSRNLPTGWEGLGDGPIILSAGRFRAVKGYDRMIRALPAVVGQIPGVRYVIIGSGPEESRWKSLALDLGMENRILWLPPVSYDQWGGSNHDCYNACDVFVGPSVRDPKTGDVEALGIATLEASACERPVVVGRCGGAAETVKDGETGWVVDAEDSDALANAVVRLLKNPDLRSKMGKAGRQRVEQEFDWRISAHRVQKVLQNLVKFRF